MYLPTSAQPTLDTPSHATAMHLCHACGMLAHDTQAVSLVYRNGVSFCLHCWEALPGAAIREVIQDVALHGDTTARLRTDGRSTTAPQIAV